MPGSTRTFTYTLVPALEDVARVERQARKVLGWACDGDTRITCHTVSGSPLGVVTLSLTVVGRDRWWATQLAQDILNRVLWGLQTNATQLQLQSRRQDPHTHRGYAHGRKKRYKDSGSSFAGGSEANSARSSGTTTESTTSSTFSSSSPSSSSSSSSSSSDFSDGISESGDEV